MKFKMTAFLALFFIVQIQAQSGQKVKLNKQLQFQKTEIEEKIIQENSDYTAVNLIKEEREMLEELKQYKKTKMDAYSNIDSEYQKKSMVQKDLKRDQQWTSLVREHGQKNTAKIEYLNSNYSEYMQLTTQVQNLRSGAKSGQRRGRG